jgi:hypothetical protein
LFLLAATGSIAHRKVVAFTSPRNHAIWVGPEQDVFIESGSQIVGARIAARGVLWAESLIHSTGPKRSELAKAIATFEKETDGRSLSQAWLPTSLELHKMRLTDLKVILSMDFYVASPGSSQGAQPRLVDFDTKGAELRITLASPTGVHSATVWIDVETRRVVKAEENGQQVFPPERQ